MRFIGLEKKYRHLKRLRHIVNVLIKHGFGYLIEELPLAHLLTASRRILIFRRSSPHPDMHPLTLAERLRLVCEELGPTFVKLGQLLSTRSDLVPLEIAEEFKKLQDNVPPAPFNQIKPQLEAELKSPIGQVFITFDIQPTAAASIAQVYTATLADAGPVVVKVQRPGIEPVIEQDIHILFYLARMLEKYIPETRFYSPVGIVEEFSRSIRRELNFMLEASNAQHMRELFADDPTVYIPQIYGNLTSHKAMVMEKIKGVPIDELEQLRAQGHDPKQIAVSGCKAYLKQVFEFGFFHADPHPGNIMVMAEGQIAFVDFGIMGRLDAIYTTYLANIFFALANRDYDRLVAEYLNFGVITPETNLRRFKEDLIDFIEPYYGQPLKNIPVSEVFNYANKLMLAHRMKLMVELVLLGKTLVFVEGIGRQLDPGFNLLAIAKPYAATLLKKRLSPKILLDKISLNLTELSDLAKTIPRQLQILLRKAIQGELEIVVNQSRAEEVRSQQRQSQNRLAMAMVISALIVGSSLIMQAGHRPYLFGMPILGFLGFVTAFVLGVWLIISMIISWRR